MNFHLHPYINLTPKMFLVHYIKKGAFAPFLVYFLLIFFITQVQFS